jgi:hypothetical protein
MGLTQLNRQEQFLLTTRINERRAASITGLNLLKSISCDEKKYSIDERRLKANLKRKNFQCTTMVKMAKQCGTWIQRKEQGRNPKRRSLTFYNHEVENTMHSRSSDFAIMLMDSRSHSCASSKHM